jgi:hypothetical protein
MKTLSHWWWQVAAAVSTGWNAASAEADGLGSTSGLLPRDHLANLGVNCPDCVQTVRLESPHPAAESVRTGGGRLPGRAGLQPHPCR